MLARGPVVLGTVRLIYTGKHVQVFSMLISETAPLEQERHSSICEFLRLCDSGSHMISRALSRAVQKETGRLSSAKSNCMACCFDKAKTSVSIKERNKVIPCTTLTCIKAAAIRPAASYFELSKSSALKKGVDAPHSFAWFDVVEASFSDELWYCGTFTYILHEISDEISRQDTPIRKAVTLNRRLAIALYYLALTAEYRMIGNLFGVSVAFVCT